MNDTINTYWFSEDALRTKLATYTDMLDSLRKAGFRGFRVRELTNRYCGMECCQSRVGLRIEFPMQGWGAIEFWPRKNVRVIRWEESVLRQTDKIAEALFPEEDVTKIGYEIHSWDRDHDLKYLTRLHQAFEEWQMGQNYVAGENGRRDPREFEG